MADIAVKIVRLPQGQMIDVELPDDARVGDLLPVLAERLGEQAQEGGATIYKLGYKGPTPPEQFSFADDDTLAGRGAKPGCILTFTKEFIAGL
jgi:hypothetical protein